MITNVISDFNLNFLASIEENNNTSNDKKYLDNSDAISPDNIIANAIKNASVATKSLNILDAN